MNWWPHQLYRLEIDEIFDHEEFALGKKGKKAHESYVEKELKQKKDFEQKFKELLEKARGELSSVLDNSQVLQEEKRVL